MEVAAGFTSHIDFEQYARGPLDGQDGWTASPAAAIVADPLNGNNWVATQSGPNVRSYREVPSIPEGETGTLFFRMLRSGNVDTSFGLTDVDNPSTTSHSRAYVNHQNDNVLRVRNGGAFATAGAWAPDVWQCVWIVADNATDKVTVYSQGGPYAQQTRLPEGSEAQFGFREPVSGDLDRFYWINGTPNPGTQYLDDVAVDVGGANLAIPSDNPADCQVGEVPAAPLLNPLPDPTPSLLGIEVAELVQLPASTTTPAASDQIGRAHV